MAGVRRKPSASGKYQGFFTNYEGQKQYFTGSKNRAETRRAAARLEDQHRKVRLGEKPRPDVVDKCRRRLITEVISEYKGWGMLQGGRGGRPWSHSHTVRKKRLLDLWVETLSLETMADLDGLLPRVEAALQELSKQGKSGKTLHNTVEALRSFINWCLIRKYLREDPLKGLSKIDITPKTKRRAMTSEEFKRLLAVAPYHRQVLYMVAVITGLRANELRSLRREHLDTEQLGLWLDAEWTKNRKPGFQPLPEATVKLLGEYFDSGIVPRLYSQYIRTKVFHSQALLYVPSEPSKDLERDMEHAGIPKKTAAGKLDFHAMRTSFVSLTIEAGATAKEAQQLARHSDPRITMNVYARATDERLSQVVGKVANRVFSGALGVNRVREGLDNVTQEKVKMLAAKEVMGKAGDWSRGESNPHLRDATAS